MSVHYQQPIPEIYLLVTAASKVTSFDIIGTTLPSTT